MNGTTLEILLIAVVTALACALPGVFLVLQRKAMLADAISHTVLLGIVLGFFATGHLDSPLLVLGAAAVGVLTVSLVTLVERTGLVRSDAATGLVFPVLFSVAVILISIYARDIHLDVDAVLVGEIAFAPFDRLTLGGADLGPRGLWVMGGILLINLVFVALLYKELKLTTFDAGLAATLGFAPALLHYALMSLVSVTVVGAFDIVGSVLVVALMVAPPAAASLISERLPGVLLWSLGIGAASALGGYALAYVLDASIAGAMASMTGVWFTLALLFAPRRGLLAEARRRRTQREAFAVTMLTAHLLNHEAKPEAEMENRMSHLGEHLRWGADFAARVVRLAERQGLLQQSGGALRLTEAGRAHAQSEFIR